MLLPNLKIDSSLITPFVLLPGDPARVEAIGQKLDNFEVLNFNREFKTARGRYKAVPITVCSTGIGCPSAAIAAEELINTGAKVLIRVGTCGGAWRKEIPVGSLVIPTACVRDEGTTPEYIDRGFPAVADFGALQALVQSAKKQKYKYFTGINRTHDAFYGSQMVIRKWGEYLLEERWRGCDTPILSSDMETSALLIIASLRGIKAGAVLAVNAEAEPLKDRLVGQKQKVIAELSEQQTKQVVEKAILTALDALVILAGKRRN